MSDQGTTEPLDLEDIQCNILRGYRAKWTRHYLLRIPQETIGRRFLKALLPGTAADPSLTVTDARFMTPPPDYCLNLALSWSGLAALGVEQRILRDFPDTFKRGAARSRLARDSGLSDPGDWEFGGAEDEAHMVASLSFREESADSAPETMARLEQLIHDSGVELTADQPPEGYAWPGAMEQFGYRDGIGQPWITGSPGRGRPPSMQAENPPGDFLLSPKFRNSFLGYHIGKLDPRIATHGTYGVFQMMEQDVAAFREYVESTASRLGETTDWLMAKLVGRWKEGAALSVWPTPPTSQPTASQLDNFDYVKPPGAFDDGAGERCPIGAHARRLNPRHQPIMGNNALAHRVIRRALPYGPPYDPSKPPDGEKRGLVGYFFCGDIEAQFEFIIEEWGIGSRFTPGIRGTQDPFVGDFDSGKGQFKIPIAGKQPLILEDLPRVVEMRGRMYTFLPGFAAMRRLGDGEFSAP